MSSIKAVADCKTIAYPPPRKFIKCKDQDFTIYPILLFYNVVCRVCSKVKFISLCIFIHSFRISFVAVC